MQDDTDKTNDAATQDNAADATPSTSDAPVAAAVARPLPEFVNEPMTAEGNTYLHELCRTKARPALIAEAIEVMGAIPDLPNKAGLPPMAYAISEGDAESVMCLYHFGASIVTGEFNAVLYAVSADKADALDVLLRHGRGQGVNVGGLLVNKENSPDTPLLAAISSPRDEMVAPLLQAGAFVNVRRKKDGASALHIAAGRINVDLVRALLSAGADTSLFDHDGMTPLHVAAAEGRTDALQALIDHGVDVDIAGQGGQTALHMAVVRKKLESVKILLAAGANPDCLMPGMDNETPLMAAARRGHDEIAVELLAGGANPLIENSRKQTAADIVNQESHRELYTFIKGEEDYRLREHFEKAHRRLVDARRVHGPDRPPRFGR